MDVPIGYLDSSALVKRYVKERGSDVVASLFRKAYDGDAAIAFSIYNIGEVLTAFDKAARRQGREELYYRLKRLFLGEVRRMIRLKICRLVPANTSVLKASWSYIEKHHIYAADALQIASAKYVGSSVFYTGDEALCEAARGEGLKCVLL
ncbi:MAG: type II toxin-antitoxin system VapC family toxin [Thermoproteus sp.]